MACRFRNMKQNQSVWRSPRNPAAPTCAHAPRRWGAPGRSPAQRSQSTPSAPGPWTSCGRPGPLQPRHAGGSGSEQAPGSERSRPAAGRVGTCAWCGAVLHLCPPASHTARRSLTVRSALRQGKGRLPADAAGGARDNADQAAGGAAHQLQGRHIPHPQLLHGMRGACGSPAAAAPRRSRLITPTCRKTSTPTLANSRQYLIASMVNGGQSETQ